MATTLLVKELAIAQGTDENKVRSDLKTIFQKE
jgi:hypothetical protein